MGAEGDNNKLNIYGGKVEAVSSVYLGGTNGASEKNAILISGSDAELYVTDQLVIGSSVSSNNAVTVNNGGTLEVTDRANIQYGSATNNTLTVGNGGFLKTTDWDLSVVDSNLTFATGGGLWLTGEFTGTNALEGGFNLTLDQSAALWTSTNEMFVGRDTDNNSLTITNGAKAQASAGMVIGEDSRGNRVTVGGAGSLLEVTGDLTVGKEDNVPFNPFTGQYLTVPNNLIVVDGGLVTVSQDMNLFSGASLSIDSKSSVNVAGNYSQDQFSWLEVGISSNQTTANLVVDGTAAFESSYNTNESHIIRVYNDGIDTNSVVAIVRADEITLDGSDVSGSAFQGRIETNSLLKFTATVTNDASYTYIVLSDFLKSSIADAGGLEGQLRGGCGRDRV